MASVFGSPAQPVDCVTRSMRRCVFCVEEIHPGASICPHCRSPLQPVQGIADRLVTLEEKHALLEQQVAALGVAPGSSLPASAEMPASSLRPDFQWPHMVDNVFLGMSGLLAAHWLATTLTGDSRVVFRLAALVVALPFGFRFEHYSRSGAAGRVLASLASGCVGALAIGVLDMASGGHAVRPPTTQDIVATIAVIALSHFTGSELAHMRQRRADRAVAAFATQGPSHINFEPDRIKTAADAVKALYDAVVPLAAGAAALWATFQHFLT